MSTASAHGPVDEHPSTERGWFRVGGPPPKDGTAWHGFISPTDPKTGRTIATDRWLETWPCDTRVRRIRAPFPVDSPPGKTVHRT